MNIKVLIADDSSVKVKHIVSFLEEVASVSCFVVTDINSAKDAMLKDYFDLFILDLLIPNRFGDDPKAENAVSFLSIISKINRIKVPFHIIGLTAHGEHIEKYKLEFSQSLWTLVLYDETKNMWKQQIKNKINYLVQSKLSLLHSNDNTFDYHLAIVTALHDPELSNILKLDASWEVLRVPNTHFVFYTGLFKSNNKVVKVVAAAANQMGMVATAFLTQKMIEFFRPMYIAMTGICAGVVNKSNFGDIILAESSFDYGSGKIIYDENGNREFEADFRSIEINPQLKSEFKDCQLNSFFVESIKKGWNLAKPLTDLKLIIGPLASGSAVVANAQVVSEVIRHSRKLVAIDMETYAVYYTAYNSSSPKPLGFFSLKSVTDFADSGKTDDYHLYAAYTSSQFLFHFVVQVMNFDVY